MPFGCHSRPPFLNFPTSCFFFVSTEITRSPAVRCSSAVRFWQSIQEALFPHLEQTLGPLTAKQQQLVQTLEVIRIEQWIPPNFRAPGRPPGDRAALARAFVAKAVYDMPTTRVLLERLDTDVALRRICGWERRSPVPSESVFSRAFAEFSDSRLPQRVHEALIRKTHGDRLVNHLSRDSTAIEARERPAAKEKTQAPPKRERGRRCRVHPPGSCDCRNWVRSRITTLFPFGNVNPDPTSSDAIRPM